jgi:hypothetical protein
MIMEAIGIENLQVEIMIICLILHKNARIPAVGHLIEKNEVEATAQTADDTVISAAPAAAGAVVLADIRGIKRSIGIMIDINTNITRGKRRRRERSIIDTKVKIAIPMEAEMEDLIEVLVHVLTGQAIEEMIRQTTGNLKGTGQITMKAGIKIEDTKSIFRDAAVILILLIHF